MNYHLSKLENPTRIEELQPLETLQKIGFGPDQTLCDIGAGSGIFTLPAARLSQNTIYALETNAEYLNLIKEKAGREGLDNIVPVKVNGGGFDLPTGTADLALMSAVLHEIDDTASFLGETRRIIKDRGKLALIEFHDWPTPFGPPPQLRIGRDRARQMFSEAGFDLIRSFDIGQNYYCLIFQPRADK